MKSLELNGEVIHIHILGVLRWVASMARSFFARRLEVKVEIRIFIVHYVHWFFDKNSENSHFSTFTHLAKSGRNHDISLEMIALGLS